MAGFGAPVIDDDPARIRPTVQDIPEVAVVIPTYNCAPYLLRAVDSVFSQTFSDLEVFVIDDGSTDETDRLLHRLPPKVTFVRQTHSGQAAARNRGISISSSPYIAFLDADDVWLPRKLEQQIELLERRPEVGLVCSDCATSDGGTRKDSFLKEAIHLRGNAFELLLQDCFIFTPTVVVRRECLREFGGFNERLEVCEDFNLWLKIASRWQMAIAPDALAVRYLRPESLSKRIRPEDACAIGIQALEDVASSCRSLSAPQNRALKKVLTARYYQYGSFLLSAGKNTPARDNLFACWQSQPTHWRALTKYSFSFLPRLLLERLITMRDCDLAS